MIRPKRRRIMVRTAARASRNVAVRLTAITSSQASSLSCTSRLSRVMAALATRMSSLPIASSAFGTSASTCILVGQIAGQHMHALLELAGELIEHLAPRAREGDSRALLMQGARDGAADAAGGAGDQGRLAGQIEHAILLDRATVLAARGLEGRDIRWRADRACRSRLRRCA